jgi:hypothetical protein
MNEGGDSIFLGHNILNPLLLTIDTNKGQYLGTKIYSESPTLKMYGGGCLMFRGHILKPFFLTKEANRESMFHNNNILIHYP